MIPWFYWPLNIRLRVPPKVVRALRHVISQAVPEIMSDWTERPRKRRIRNWRFPRSRTRKKKDPRPRSMFPEVRVLRRFLYTSAIFSNWNVIGSSVTALVPARGMFAARVLGITRLTLTTIILLYRRWLFYYTITVLLLLNTLRFHPINRKLNCSPFLNICSTYLPLPSLSTSADTWDQPRRSCSTTDLAPHPWDDQFVSTVFAGFRIETSLLFPPAILKPADFLNGHRSMVRGGRRLTAPFLIYGRSCSGRIHIELPRDSSAYLQRPAWVVHMMPRRLTQRTGQWPKFCSDLWCLITSESTRQRLIQFVQDQLSDNGLNVERPQNQIVCMGSIFRRPPIGADAGLGCPPVMALWGLLPYTRRPAASLLRAFNSELDVNSLLALGSGDLGLKWMSHEKFRIRTVRSLSWDRSSYTSGFTQLYEATNWQFILIPQ